MDPTIHTSRLKLTLVTTAERGSPEFEWFYSLYTDPEATFTSLLGVSKSTEDVEKRIKAILPVREGEAASYRAVYAVHRHLPPASPPPAAPQPTNETPTQFIGVVRVKSLEDRNLDVPEACMLPGATSPDTMHVELAYAFLPGGWGQGFATEAVSAFLGVCRRARSFWLPFEKAYIRAIVGEHNVASQRVMVKVGMPETGVYHWVGEAVFMAGEWRTEEDLHIYGMYLM